MNKKLRVGKKIGKHYLWHWVAMIVYQETVNLVWLAVGIVLTVAGWAIFSFVDVSFFKLAIGLPLVLVGISVALFKVYELFLVILNPARIRAVCIFCSKGVSKDEEEDY